MSIESAKAFLERMTNDEEWLDKLNGAESKEERLAMAKTEGFDFTGNEFDNVRSQLSDEALGRVSPTCPRFGIATSPSAWAVVRPLAGPAPGKCELFFGPDARFSEEIRPLWQNLKQFQLNS